MREYEILFQKLGDFKALLESLNSELTKEIQSLSKEKFLEADEKVLINDLVKQFTVTVPDLKDENMVVHPAEEVDLNASTAIGSFVSGDAGPSSIKGECVVVAIPFEGDGHLFHAKPSAFASSNIRGVIVNDELHLKYEGMPQEMNAEKLKREIQRDIEIIKRHLQGMTKIAEFQMIFVKSHTERLIMTKKEQK